MRINIFSSIFSTGTFLIASAFTAGALLTPSAAHAGSPPWVTGLMPTDHAALSTNAPTFSFMAQDDTYDHFGFGIIISEHEDLSSPLLVWRTDDTSNLLGAYSFTMHASPPAPGYFLAGSDSITLDGGTYYWAIELADDAHDFARTDTRVMTYGGAPLPPSCGNGTCSAIENHDSCPADCVAVLCDIGDLPTRAVSEEFWTFVPGHGTSPTNASEIYINGRLQIRKSVGPNMIKVEIPDYAHLYFKDADGYPLNRDLSTAPLSIETGSIPPGAPVGTAAVMSWGFTDAEIESDLPITFTMALGAAYKNQNVTVYTSRLGSVWSAIGTYASDDYGNVVFTTTHASDYAGVPEGGSPVPEFSSLVGFITVLSGFGAAYGMRKKFGWGLTRV